MSTRASSNLTLLNFPAGAGTVLPASARGEYLVTLWTVAGADLTTRVRKDSNAAGELLSVLPAADTSASLAWVGGALVVNSSVAEHRYGSSLQC
jgi:hypothetical protein